MRNVNASASVTNEGDEHENQLQASACAVSELSPSSSLIRSAASSSVRHQSVAGENIQASSGQMNSSDSKKLGLLAVTETPLPPDGFGWRKYGQKQVKCPRGFRSYYKCTRTNCHAKKIELCDFAGHVIQIVNKGSHDHDPPLLSSLVKKAGSSAPGNEPESETSSLIRDRNVQNFSVRANSLVPRRRGPPPSPPGERARLVLRASEFRISGDGFKWRKYGQKMVKGNPHPRNYYRCTSLGCPVRKYIETASDNTDAYSITYTGVHNHDVPHRNLQPCLPDHHLPAIAAPISKNNLQLKEMDHCQTNLLPHPC